MPCAVAVNVNYRYAKRFTYAPTLYLFSALLKFQLSQLVHRPPASFSVGFLEYRTRVTRRCCQREVELMEST